MLKPTSSQARLAKIIADQIRIENYESDDPIDVYRVPGTPDPSESPRIFPGASRARNYRRPSDGSHTHRFMTCEVNTHPEEGGGARCQRARRATTNHPNQLLAQLLVDRNATLHLACCALSADELLEWLKTEHGRLAVAVVEANRS